MKKAVIIMFLFIFFITSCGKNTENNVQTDIAAGEENTQTTWYYQEEKSAYEKPGPAVEPEGDYGILRDFYEMGIYISFIRRI